MNSADKQLAEMIEQQWQKMEKLAKQIVPTVTRDDLWQPNDFPELEQNPLFRYEEGIATGLQMPRWPSKPSPRNKQRGMNTAHLLGQHLWSFSVLSVYSVVVLILGAFILGDRFRAKKSPQRTQRAQRGIYRSRLESEVASTHL